MHRSTVFSSDVRRPILLPGSQWGKAALRSRHRLAASSHEGSAPAALLHTILYLLHTILHCSHEGSAPAASASVWLPDLDRRGRGRVGGMGRGREETKGEGWIAQGRAGQGRAGQGRAGQGRAGQGKAVGFFFVF